MPIDGLAPRRPALRRDRRRLTPPRTRTRSGKRLGYHVSHRPVGRSGEPDLSGWRLPTRQLEATALRLIRARLGGQQAIAILAQPPEVEVVAAARTRLQDLASSNDLATVFALVARTHTAPGRITVRLDATGLRSALGLPFALAEHDPRLIATAAFRSRRRGVETKLVPGGETSAVNQVLLANIARAGR